MSKKFIKEDKSFEEEGKEMGKDYKTGQKKPSQRVSNKGKRKGSSRDDSKPTKSGFSFNSPLWANYNPALLDAIANLSCNTKVGQRYNLGNKYEEDFELQGYICAPSVLAIRYISSPGISTDETSALNISAQSMLSYMRSVLNIRNTYDKTDLMMYYCACVEALSLVEHCKKLLSCARVFSIRNRDIGAMWIQAYGVDVDDLRAHHKTYVSRLNIEISKLAQMNIPNHLPFMQRATYMSKNIYMDVPDTPLMAQTYLFVPDGFRKYERVQRETPPYLKFEPLFPRDDEESITMDFVLQYLDDMINRIVNDEDTGNISGDIRNTFGPDKCYEFSFTNEDIMAVPIYDSGLQAQIENARSVPIDFSNAAVFESLHIKPTIDEFINPIIIFDPLVAGSAADGYMVHVQRSLLNVMLNTHWNEIKPLDVSYITRLVCTPELESIVFENEVSCSYHLKSTGTEIVTGFNLYHDGNWSSIFQSCTDQEYTDQATLYALNSFDWHPIVYIFETGDSLVLNTPYCDLDNFLLVSNDTMSAINDIVLMSYWQIPAYGVYGHNSGYTRQKK